MDIACQSDTAEIGARVTDLAAKLVSCAAVDITQFSAAGDLRIPASSDRAFSALTKIVWKKFAPATGFVSWLDGRSTWRYIPGYTEQLRADCRISGERMYELKVADICYGHLRFLLRDDDLFPLADDELASAFATHAAIALDRAALLQKVNHLQTAIDTNREIGAAVGILMAGHAINYPGGFQLLLNISQNDNRKLRDVAAEVVYTGALPRQRFGSNQSIAALGRPTPLAGLAVAARLTRQG